MDRVLRFWQEVATVQATKPGWSLAHIQVAHGDTIALHRFHDAGPRAILIIPPNAGHHSCIAEPLIRTCIETAPEHSVFAMDWLPAQRNNAGKDETLTALYEYVDGYVNLIGGPVHLIGLCQGGWLAAIYAALQPESVCTLTLAAAPVDFHAAGDANKLEYYVKRTPAGWFQFLVRMAGGVQAGQAQLAAFRAMNPWDRYVGDYAELWAAIDKGNEEAILRWRRNHIWYDNPQAIGGWFLEAVEKLFKENLLVKGELEIAGQRVSLGRIVCPVAMLIGSDDDITHPSQLFALGHHVASRVIRKRVVPDCGHIGIFLRRQALEVWTELLKANMEQEATGPRMTPFLMPDPSSVSYLTAQS